MSCNILKAKTSLRPARMWIDGKCFNIRPFKQQKLRRENNTTEITEDSDFNISSDGNGMLCTSFKLPEIYSGKIMKHRDFKVHSLEAETNTKISIPRNGYITITGQDHVQITEARHQLHSIIDNIRYLHKPLQFTSIPVASDEIKENFERFKNQILGGEPIVGMDESIFQKSLKLHLTISVFSLFDESEINEAKLTLQNCNENVLRDLIAGAGPLKIEIAGLNCMDRNWAKVNVLYANARLLNENENLNLQKIVDGIADYFYERGFIRNPEEKVKLHCTLINTKYRKEPNSKRSNKRWQKRLPFDGRAILEKYKDYYFGVCNLDSIHLSLMSGGKSDDGFYKAVSVLKLDNQ